MLATELDSKNPTAWTLRAMAAEGQGKTKEAARAYRRALRLSPSSGAARDGVERLTTRST